MHLVQTLVFFPFTIFDWMLMENFRLVAMLEWLREFPETAPRPQVAHTLLIYL